MDSSNNEYLDSSNKKYIFVLCPPLQGSTIIINLLSSSKNVSTFLDSPKLASMPSWNGREGQYLMEHHGDINFFQNRWNPNYNLDMSLFNRLFEIYMDKSKTIFVEKSPSAICRAKKYEEYFSKLGEVYFIISIRNPYSTNYEAEKWVKFAKYQKYNINTLKNTIVTNYEEICLNLNIVIEKIKYKIPELSDIHNHINNNIGYERGNLIHKKKVYRIIDKETKNIILQNYIELLEYFGYKLIE